MKRITKEPWFNPRSKALGSKSERPITWQGWAILIVYISIFIALILFYILYFDSHEWRSVLFILVLGSWIPFRLVVTLTSDNLFFGNVDKQREPCVSSAEIRRKLNEKRKNLE